MEEKKEEKFKKDNGKTLKFVEQDWVLVCADCKKVMPRYENAPNGYVSPESSEFKPTTLDGKAAIEALEKPVCYECYNEALIRVNSFVS